MLRSVSHDPTWRRSAGLPDRGTNTQPATITAITPHPPPSAGNSVCECESGKVRDRTCDYACKCEFCYEGAGGGKNTHYCVTACTCLCDCKGVCVCVYAHVCVCVCGGPLTPLANLVRE